MTLNNINTLRKDRGFTIVELLIVIVVIAILAAITIVAYNGIQNRAKATSGQNLASQIAKKSETYNTLTSVYPTFTQLSTNAAPTGYTGSLAEAKLDDATAIVDAGTATNFDSAGEAVNGTKVGYKACATGAQVWWWDFAAATPVVKYVGIGGASSTAAC